MDIVLSAASDKPIYTQIYEQISGQILRGEIEPGTRLPPIRSVALDLMVSVIPVKQAWEQLEREGFISTAAGRGTYVRQLEHHEIDQRRDGAAKELLASAVAGCKALGLSREEIKDLAASILKSD